MGHLPKTQTQLYSEVGTVSDNLSQNLGGSLNIRASGGDGNIVTFASKDSKLAQYIDITSKGVKLNCKVDGEWGNTINLATKDDLALVSLLLSGTSEVSSSNLYATMKGKREIQVSGWFRTSSTKPTGAKIFSIPSGYTIGINTTLLAMESVSGAIISLWCDQRGTTFTTQREIPAGQYYVIPIPIQLQSA